MTKVWRATQHADGRPRLTNLAGFLRWCAEQFAAGDRLEIVVRRERRQRSNDQLRYWFGVPMRALAEATGYTKMQAHYLSLALCFGVVVDPVSGHEVPVVPMSRGLTTAQFSELMEWFGPWAFETYGISVPLPNEVDLASLPGVEEAA